ncbi:MAG: Eco57I restriction-modification methylase domain-containing protein [Methanocorpusculum sp.]|nr:Eco57I restriction-modification methylase domain-containing protein [Methanocorpusculum sp.]
MAGDVSYLRNRLLASMDRGTDLYYSDFLKPLFFVGFACPEEERDPQYRELLGNIPYLNGGLFLEHEIERQYPDIQIKDEAFLQLYDFFDDWRWYLDERPLAEGNEINPDVLGYIFEKYINQKQMGAYYTKEDITEYISKNTVIPYLFDAVAARQPRFFKSGDPIWHRLQENPDRYIYPAVKHGVELPLPADIAAGIDNVGSREDWNRLAPSDYALPTEIWREVIARRQRYQEIKDFLTAGQISSINDLITYNLDICQFAQDVIENIDDPDLLRAFYYTMAGRLPRHSKDKFQSGLSILDPTCGSGAFLFAALNILQPLYEACLQQMEHFLDEKEQSAARPRADKYADFEDIIKEVNQHRNRRYFILKSIIINNLYGVDIMDEAVEICKLRLFLKLVAQVEAGEIIEPLPDIDFNIRAGNTLVGFATYDDVKTSLQNSPQRGGLLLDDPMPAIEEKARDIERLFKNFRQMQASEGETGFDHQEYVQTKRQLEERLTVLRNELNGYLAEEYGIDPGKKKAYQKWLKSHQPFHWFIEFYGIVHEEKGFDVIIGNPPYVEYSKINYKIFGSKTESCGNLYAFILERSKALLNSLGRCGMIVPLSGHSTPRMAPLVHTFYKQFSSCYLMNISSDAHPSILFPGVRFRLVIFLVDNRDTGLFTTKYTKWYANGRNVLFFNIKYNRLNGFNYADIISKISDKIHLRILTKMSNHATRFNFLTGNQETYYHNTPVHWIRAHSFIPYFKSERDGKKQSTQLKAINFNTQESAQAASAVLCSSLFFIWWITVSDCYHLNKPEIFSFPIDLTNKELVNQLSIVAKQLEKDMKEKSQRRFYNYETSGRVEYDEFYLKKSKKYIDEIDRVLAKHYGFTDEELDFIINYDIKYRMGITGEPDDNED